jgi:ankyrin repeat protein
VTPDRIANQNDKQVKDTNDNNNNKSNNSSMNKYDKLLTQTDIQFNTILHLAAASKSTHIAKLIIDIILIDTRINRNFLRKRNANGETFFQVACLNGLCDLIEYFLLRLKQRNNDAIEDEDVYEPVHDKDNELNTCLMSCILNVQPNGSNGNLKCFKILIENNAFINACNKRKQTALHLCCRFGLVECVQMLLCTTTTTNNECEYLSVDEMRMNALDYACEMGNVELVRLLLNLSDAHLLVNAQCLFSALDGKHPYVVECLLKSKYWMLLLLRCEETLIISHLIERMVNLTNF